VVRGQQDGPRRLGTRPDSARIRADVSEFAARPRRRTTSTSSRCRRSPATIVVRAATDMPWYHGPTLLELPRVDRTSSSDDRTLPTCGSRSSWSCVPAVGSDFRGYAGRRRIGTLSPGDPIVVLPAGRHSRIARDRCSDEVRSIAGCRRLGHAAPRRRRRRVARRPDRQHAANPPRVAKTLGRTPGAGSTAAPTIRGALSRQARYAHGPGTRFAGSTALPRRAHARTPRRGPTMAMNDIVEGVARAGAAVGVRPVRAPIAPAARLSSSTTRPVARSPPGRSRPERPRDRHPGRRRARPARRGQTSRSDGRRRRAARVHDAVGVHLRGGGIGCRAAEPAVTHICPPHNGRRNALRFRGRRRDLRI
jgi:hypothetical protein